MLYFAHAGEQHDTVIEATTHSVLTEWYAALPLFFIVFVCIIFATYRLSRRSIAITYAVGIVMLLGTGVLAYKAVPALSITCLALGFAATLGQVLLGLGAKSSK